MGVGLLSMDGVFINPEDGRADSIEAFPSFALGVFVIEALNGGRAEHAACDTIPMLLIDLATERFGRVSIGFYARQQRKE